MHTGFEECHFCSISSQLLLLPVQSPCAHCFKRPIFKMSEFGVRKSLLIEKIPSWEDGGLRASSIPSSESTEFRFLLCQGQGEWEGQEVTDELSHPGASSIQGRASNLYISLFVVHWPLLMCIWSWGSWKFLINNHYFVPITPTLQERHLLSGKGLAVFQKTQASSRIPPVISISIARVICLKVMGKMQAWIRWSQGDWTFRSVTLSPLESVGNTSNTWNQARKQLLILGGWLLAIPYTSSSAPCCLQYF